MRKVLGVGVILSSLQLFGCGDPDAAGVAGAGSALPGASAGLPGAPPLQGAVTPGVGVNGNPTLNPGVGTPVAPGGEPGAASGTPVQPGVTPGMPGAPAAPGAVVTPAPGPNGTPAPAGGAAVPVPPELEAVGACTEPEHLLSPRMIRFSHTELQRHIQDSLPGISDGLLRNVKFQADHLATASARGMSGAEFGVYFGAAKNVANAYAADSPELEACRTESPGADCLTALNQAVERLYRAPVDAADWDQSADMFERLAADQGAEKAAAAVIAGALISPQTLYHTESGESPEQPGVYRLTQRETLSLARYAVTGKGPTQEELGLLGRTPEEFDKALGEFASSWASSPDFAERMIDLSEEVFGVKYLSAVQRSEEVFTPAVQTAMAEEFRGFVRDKMLSPGGSFADLFLQNPDEIMPELEEIYEDDELSPDGSSPRLGILGLPSLLATLSAPGGSDPVMRGLLVRELLLCEALPPPVPDASFSQVDVNDEMQTRERFDALAQTEPCAACHQTINPPGYLFENFDHLGRYRIEEKGRPVNAVSTITPPFGREAYPGVGEWDGIVPLAQWLAESPDARRCFAKNFASFVLADTIPLKLNNCNIDAVASRFVETAQVSDLVADVVRSPLFTHRSREAQQ